MASYRAVALRCMLTFVVAAAFARSVPGRQSCGGGNQTLAGQVEPRIKAIYETNEFATRSFQATWLPDGSGYLKLETPAGAAVADNRDHGLHEGQGTEVHLRMLIIRYLLEHLPRGRGEGTLTVLSDSRVSVLR